MRIAIPVAQERLCPHFGHCDHFRIIDINDNLKKVINKCDIIPPVHEPGALPKLLSGLNVDLIIAGGMGQRAQQLFAQNDIDVVIGAKTNSPEELVSAYLGSTLEIGDNICDH